MKTRNDMLGDAYNLAGHALLYLREGQTELGKVALSDAITILEDLRERTVVKTCGTCERRSGNFCNLSGLYYSVERKYPLRCGNDYSGWVPRVGLRQRLVNFWYGNAQR